jgi:hypothetical protein
LSVNPSQGRGEKDLATQRRRPQQNAKADEDNDRRRIPNEPAAAHDPDFSRIYAAYGGGFIALSLAWGWILDGQRPDRVDVLGGLLCLPGVGVIMHSPRP